MSEAKRPLLLTIADSPSDEGEYEPFQLWLLPVLLRTRDRFYADAIAKVRSAIEQGWRLHGHLYQSRSEFDGSSYVRGLWQNASPYWWGLNDIVGYIDVRANLAKPAVEATLFLTQERASRALTRKRFVSRAQEAVALVGGQTNVELCEQLDAAVTRLREGPRVRRRYVDLESWRKVLHHTDVMSIIVEELEGFLG